ncbi:hypothetical protein R1flu_023497 [Riccia fluitans]|uniref:Calcium-binding protein 39-like n=1 Tax=Riccia fluitans TaxID=41844 RepID=A0ABD1XS76_9MARC
MSFNFFKQFKLKSPSELVKVTREALLALDSKTVAEVRLLEKALEEVDKNLVAMKHMLMGEGDAEPNPEQVSQLTFEACKDDFLELLVQKLPSLGWDARKDSVNIWCTLLRQNIGGRQYGLEFIEKHAELLDFLVSCYETKEIALNCGNMLRECARYPSLAKYMLESASFELFFKYVELPNFDIASDAFSTFKELLTRHEVVVCQYLTTHYKQFFRLYDRLLGSSNYVTRRQSLKLLGEFLLERSNAPIMMQYISEVHNLRNMMTLIKDPSKNIQSSAFHVFKVFVANPNKTPAIVNILFKNREKLLRFIDNFHLDKEDEQFEEEKELLIKEIESLQPVE